MAGEAGCGQPSCRGTSGQINHGYCRDCAPWCACGNRREECDGSRAGCVRPAATTATFGETSDGVTSYPLPPCPECGGEIEFQPARCVGRCASPAGLDTTATRAVLDDVLAERGRQHARWGQQDLPDGTGGHGALLALEEARADVDGAVEMGTLTYRHIAAEEVAEAMAETDDERLEVECVQAAAVFVQWVEAIRRRRAAKKETTDA